MILETRPDGLRPIGYCRHSLACAIKNGRLPEDMSLEDALAMAQMTDLRLDLPDPYDYVDERWDAGERALVVSYLRAGARIVEFRGLSSCRFRCGVDQRVMGNACLSDGTFTWPEGFAHYLEAHHVRPPEEFVQHALRGGKRIPAASQGV